MAWASIPMRILRPDDGATGRRGDGATIAFSPVSLSPRLPVSSSAIQLIQFDHRLIESLEPAFVRAESRGVIDAAAVDGARAMFHMEHFVIEHEFYQGFRDRGAVKRTTNNYRFVNVIVMT